MPGHPAGDAFRGRRSDAPGLGTHVDRDLKPQDQIADALPAQMLARKSPSRSIAQCRAHGRCFESTGPPRRREQRRCRRRQQYICSALGLTLADLFMDSRSDGPAPTASAPTRRTPGIVAAGGVDAMRRGSAYTGHDDANHRSGLFETVCLLKTEL